MTVKGNWVCFGQRTDVELHNGTYSLDVEYFNEPGFTRLDRR